MKVLTPQIFYIDNIIQIINEYINQDNNLLNCNKYLSKLKYFELNKKYSLEYIQNINFKNLIHSKIINSKFQLNLGFCEEITNECLKHLGNLHTLDLSGCKKIIDEGLKHLGNVKIIR
jgi:hypothetical protein